MERIRRTLAALALVALAAGSFQPYYLRIWRTQWRVLGAYLTELPYRKTPGMRALLVEVDKRTPPGARILFVTPHPSWADGYDYAFRRAQYLLAGKDVIPLFGGTTRDAEYIACWNRCATPAGFTVIWTSDAGSLARRGK